MNLSANYYTTQLLIIYVPDKAMSVTKCLQKQSYKYIYLKKLRY